MYLNFIVGDDICDNDNFCMRVAFLVHKCASNVSAEFVKSPAAAAIKYRFPQTGRVTCVNIMNDICSKVMQMWLSE